MAVAAPAPAAGAFRPTSLYTYGAHDNLFAYCDPIATHGLQADWTSPPVAPVPGQGGLCPTQSTTATRYQWTATTNEPFGELASSTSPATPAAQNGYQRTYAYDPGRQGGLDYGLTTSVTGAAITQNDASTPIRQPQQSFWYDANGDLVCYGTGNGQWLLVYDALGRPTSTADPDDSASGSGICGKAGAQAGWNTTIRTSYFPDGSVASKQSASQVANGVSTSFTYDLDGNSSTETHHHGCLTVSNCVAGVTQKFYDGDDRLIEVLQPWDGWDVQSYPWGTRYIYDLSQGGTTSYRGTGLAGYGNLVSTQELLSGNVWQPNFQTTYTIGTGSWTDIRATAFDALDRGVASYEAAFGDQAKERRTYDAGSQAGLLSSVTLATNEIKQYTYDGMGRQTDTNYSGDGGVTPGTHVTLDADGRVLASRTDVLGTETMQYDGAGNLLSVTEPASIGGAVISYDYYPDGKRQNLKYVGGGYAYTPLLQYGYRNDGQRDVLQLNNGTSFQWTYTAAGREQSQTDPLTGATIHPDETYDGGGNHQYPYYPSSLTYVPRTLTYDTYGRLAHLGLSESLLSYDFSAAQYDLEDAPIAETANRYSQSHAGVGSSVPVVSCLPTTVRNEQMTKRPPFIQANGCSSVVPSRIDYNGTVLPAVNVHDLNSQPAWTLDARAGLLLNDQATTANGNIVASAYVHDISGRLIQDSEGTEPLCPAGFSPVPNARCYTNGTKQKTYDAENRLRSETYSYLNTSSATPTTYGFSTSGAYWNADGYQPATIQAVDYDAGSHPARFTLYHPNYAGYPYANEVRAWLWDGNDRLLTCQLVNAQCTAPSFSVEGLGDYSPVSGAIAINDRDRAGVVVTAHDRVGFRNWTDSMGSAFLLVPGNANDVCSTANDAICNSPHDGKLTDDGWTLDDDTWQGVRTYDATVGQWNTPDAYAGDVHDPMSQKPFMWNRNNPYQYSDPTGYASRPNPIEVIRQILERVKAGKYPTKPGASGGDSAYRPFPKKMNDSLKGGGECPACGSTERPLQGDHVVARSRGGNATPENHQKLCNFCNPSKGDKSDWDWIARLADKLTPGGSSTYPHEGEDSTMSDGEQALWDLFFGKRPPPPKPNAPPGRK